MLVYWVRGLFISCAMSEPIQTSDAKVLESVQMLEKRTYDYMLCCMSWLLRTRD
jgi:hypothetical protein